MSDTQKLVEETTAPAAAPAAPAEPAVVSEPPATSDEITSTDAPAPAKEDSKVEEKKDAADTAEPPKPISGGHLGYKGPGLVKGLRFSKRYIWFGDDAVEAKDLSNYLRGEKPDVAHPTVAWSTQTGKGLLYFTKTVDQKAQPIHAINLADISDVCTDGLYEFYFKVHGQKHSFQTQIDYERDAWVEALKTKLEEAKGMVESITKSDGYTENLEKLGKPAVGAKTDSTPKKSTDKAPEGVKRGDASGSEGETGERKPSRSVSRKRGSIFGFMTKREEAKGEAEQKKDKEGDKKEEGKTEEAAAVAEPAAESAKTEEPAPTAAAVTAPVEEAAEQAAEPKDTPKPSKRASIFGSIMRKDKKDTAIPVEEKKEVAPATPAKDTEAAPAAEPVEVPSKPAESADETAAAPTSASASPKKSGVLSFFKKEYRHAKEEAEAAPKVDEPAAPATETETPAPTEAATETTEPAATSEQPKTRRRSSFFTDLVGKVAKKPGEVSDSETEHKEKSSPSPLPKLQGLFRGKSHREHKKDETKKEATPPPTVEETAEPATESKDAAPAAELKSEETPAAAAAAAEPSQTNVVNGTIGDVVGDAITVGQTPPTVQAAA